MGEAMELERKKYLIKDIFSAGSSHPHDLVSNNVDSFFVANDEVVVLWKTDGNQPRVLQKSLTAKIFIILKKVKDK
jgi:hypothetical protein